jgi:hypothetical protein
MLALAAIALLLATSPATPAAAPLQVETTVSATQVRLGEALTLSITARGDDLSSLTVVDPVPDEPTLKDLPTTWSVRKITERPSKKDDEVFDTKTFRYELIAFAAGETTVPQARLSLGGVGATTQPLLSAPLAVMVESLLPSNSDPAQLPIKEVADPEAIPLPKALWAGLLFAGLLVLVALVAWLVYHFKRRVIAYVRPPAKPDQIALEELARVEGDHLVEKHLIKEHYSRVSDAVRAYLGAVFGIDAMEQTSTELLGTLAETPEASVVYAEIEGLIAEADLVKFAQLVPESGRCKRALETGRRIVLESRFLLQPPPEVSGPAATPPPDGRARQATGQVRR